MVESSPKQWKTLGKAKIAHYEQFLISQFPAVFSKDLYSRDMETRACLEKGLND